MRCKFCGTEDQNDFTIWNCKRICDDCMSILNVNLEEAKKDLDRVFSERNRGERWECDFYEGLDEYASYLGNQFNKRLKEERNVHDIARDTEQGQGNERPA